ncbi:MAG: aminotransferase class V-fold PLP-dependent enzyme [Mycoplasmataceae bacterium]|nr:aminotransferase class V-fold PLP-dependent enzyme [Mycoplasmataceae bacterium]
MTFNLIRKQFPWFKNNPGWVYADNAASSLKPQVVIDAIDEFYAKYCFNTHNTDSPLTSKFNQKIVDARKAIAQFFHAQTNEIIFTSGATESLNLVIFNVIKWLKPHDEVLVSYGEHTSNLLPWMNASKLKKIKIVYAKNQDNLPTTEAFIRAINKKTQVISFTNISNLLGYTIDVKKVAAAARKINPKIIIIVDATHSAPSIKIDVKAWDCDFLACSAHKMCGPTGIGLLYGKFALLERLAPLKYGGGMNNVLNVKTYTLSPLPSRLEGGTIHAGGIIGLHAAIQFLNKIGMKKIEKYDQELKRYIDQSFKQLKHVQYYNVQKTHAICAFNIPGVNPQDLSHYLGQQHIITRGGMSCAKLQHMFTKSEAGVVRASFYFYNNKKDVDQLVNALKHFDKKKMLKALV